MRVVTCAVVRYRPQLLVEESDEETLIFYIAARFEKFDFRPTFRFPPVKPQTL